MTRVDQSNEVDQVAQERAIAERADALRAATADWPPTDRSRLEAAIEFAVAHHRGQLRRSGEPYVTHPLAVAAVVAELRADPDTVLAAVLHDTVEDTDATIEDVHAAFGASVGALVDGATKVAMVRGDDPDTLEAARLRKLFVALAADPRVVVIKIADRLHNLRTIDALPIAKRARIGRETLALHGPLAHRMGLAAIKTELEDRAFAVAHPAEYAATRRVLADLPGLQGALDAARAELEAHLEANGVRGEVQARIKHAWSVHRKVLAGYDVASLHDLLGLRIIVGTVVECYAALGAVHALWDPVPGRIKDYIAKPKFNAYRSIHTTVHVRGRLLEVQIRTMEMHREAELGSAAHHAYKTRDDSDEPQWLRRLLDWHDASDDGEYVQAITDELATDEIWVLTPTGDVLTLPAGAGVIDFAYAIHSEVGHRCSGAKVNGRLVPLSSRLRSGDRVEILTNRTTGPSLDWLAYTATARARDRVRQWHGRIRRARTRAAGEAALAALLSKHRTDAASVSGLLLATAGLSTWEQLCDQVGSGHVELVRLERALRGRGAAHEPSPDDAPDEGAAGGAAGRGGQRPADSALAVAPGLSGVEVHLAGCCNPAPPGPLVGVSSRTRGVVAHRAGCANALASIEDSPGKAVRLLWVAPGVRVSSVHLVCDNLPGAIARVTLALLDAGVDIESSSSSVTEDGRGVQRYEITHSASRSQLRRVLRAVPGVRTVSVD
ncbi:MAG: bifunctional (p)ppGpp synthetase/guanosine-3',5'-bis(diphosphate) 3'-pyrophosphohydrolase [Acidimicrobiia bacterium]